jgi:hypothetical protein
VDLKRKYKAHDLPTKPDGKPSSEELGEGRGEDDEVTCSDGQAKITSAESPTDEASSPPPAA